MLCFFYRSTSRREAVQETKGSNSRQQCVSWILLLGPARIIGAATRFLPEPEQPAATLPSRRTIHPAFGFAHRPSQKPQPTSKGKGVGKSSGKAQKTSAAAGQPPQVPPVSPQVSCRSRSAATMPQVSRRKSHRSAAGAGQPPQVPQVSRRSRSAVTSPAGQPQVPRGGTRKSSGVERSAAASSR